MLLQKDTWSKNRGVGSIKRLGGGGWGGAPASRGTFRYWKGHLKIFWGGKKNFPVILYRNCTFLIKMFFKYIEISANKKGTFDVNLVFTRSDISLYKKGTFHHKQGHFWSFEKNCMGGTCPLCLPRFLHPWGKTLLDITLSILKVISLKVH